MQRRMLAVAAVASLGIAGPAAMAQGATLGTVFGGVGSHNYPVVIELSKTGKKMVRATTGFSLKCQLPGYSVLTPDNWKNLSIDAAGKFSAVFGPREEPADPASGASKPGSTDTGGCVRSVGR